MVVCVVVNGSFDDSGGSAVDFCGGFWWWLVMVMFFPCYMMVKRCLVGFCGSL